MSDFRPGEQVRAVLWPELGLGTVLTVTPPSATTAAAARVAKVSWSTGQKSTHSFAALAHVDQAVPS